VKERKLRSNSESIAKEHPFLVSATPLWLSMIEIFKQNQSKRAIS